MRREDRYLVFKLKDVEKYMTKEEMLDLSELSSVVNVGRSVDGKSNIQCVVVERDWPEYEPTWAAIEARVDSKTTETLSKKFPGLR